MVDHLGIRGRIDRVRSEQALRDFSEYVEGIRGKVTPFSQSGQWGDFSRLLNLVSRFYFRKISQARMAYGAKAEKGTLDAYNAAHDASSQAALSKSRENVYWCLSNGHKVKISFQLDAVITETGQIVEIKHRVDCLRGRVSKADLIQMHVYMFATKKTECILIESMRRKNSTFTQMQTVPWNQSLWQELERRMCNLVDLTNRLAEDQRMIRLFRGNRGSCSAEFLRKMIRLNPGGDEDDQKGKKEENNPAPQGKSSPQPQQISQVGTKKRKIGCSPPDVVSPHTTTPRAQLQTVTGKENPLQVRDQVPGAPDSVFMAVVIGK